MKPIRVLIGVCLAIVLCATSASIAATTMAGPGPIKGPKCGFSLVSAGDGTRVYLEPVTHRRGITCAGAKRVVRGAFHQLGENKVLCPDRAQYKDWTIRHRGSSNALHAKFTRRSRSFEISSQGSC